MQTALSATPTRVRCIGNVAAPNAAGQFTSTRLPRHRAPRFASIVAQDKGFSSGPLDEGADAYNEAYDLYQQANKVSQLQTRYEMETAWTSESPPPRGGAASAPSESAVIALLQEHGLSTREASSLFKDLYSKVSSSSSNSSPAPQAAPHPQRQPRPFASPTSNPLDIIPKEVTGVPRRQRPSQSAGNPTSGRSAVTPPSHPPQGANRAPAARQEDDWDWGASGGLHNGSTGVNGSTSSIGSAAGRAQAQGGWSAASDRSLGGCGSLPAGTYGKATGPSPFQQGCGETVTPIPYDSTSDPYYTSGFAGKQPARPGSSSSNMDERSLGGCGSLPAGAFGKASGPSPFQQGCGETVTPIPYDATSDPYNASGFSSQQPRARPNSNSHGSPSPASSQSRNAPRPTAAKHAAVTEPGRSLGGCGDVPVWNEDLFNDPHATIPNSTRNNRTTPPAPIQGRSAATDPGRSLGGCGDVPVWNEALFNEAVFDEAPPNSPFTQAAAKGRSPEGTNSINKKSSTYSAPEVPATTNPYRTTGKTESPMTLSQLSARLDRWQRVLPGVNPARLAAVDSGFLTADVGEGLKAMITLVTEMPGRDVMGMLDRVPRLLWADSLRDRVRRCVTTLTRLHPSRDAEVVKDMIAEYPELVFRMDYYTQARLIDELPIEIQNMMIVADQGIGYTYRYYRNHKTDYQAEITSDEPFEQQT